jgi:phage gp46-like protein
MTDVRLQEYGSLQAVTMDWLLDDDILDEREQLATAVRVALGTDALVGADDILPDPDSTDRGGWWGDFEAEEIWGGWPIGTKSWLLSRAKITQAPSREGSTLDRAKRYTEQALQPFVDLRMASQVMVQAARTELQRIEVYAKLYRGPLAEIDLRYQVLWEEVREPIGAKTRSIPVFDANVYQPDPMFDTNRPVKVSL